MHAIELKILHESLLNISFDDFVQKHLESSVPTGLEFIRFYPFFLSKNNHFRFRSFGVTQSDFWSPWLYFERATPKLCCFSTERNIPTDINFYNESIGEFEPQGKTT